MVTRRHRHFRALALLMFVVLANTLAAACSKDDAPSDSTIALPERTPMASAEVSADAGASKIEVGGLLVDDDDEPVTGRPIDLVDAIGHHFSLITDEGGGFWAIGAVPPYDVLVAPAPSGAIITPLVYLGLKRPDPRLEVFEHDGPEEHPASQLLRVSVTVPPCRAASGSCFVSLASASATGRGATADSYLSGSPTTLALAIEHVFGGAALTAGETIDVHVLTGDVEYTQYAYAAVTGLVATAGAESDVAVAPLAIDSSAPVSIAARSSGVPLGWDWTLSSELELLGGAVVSLRYDWISSTSMRLPLLPGAVWRVNAWAQAPITEDDTATRRSSQARSGTLPVPAANVALDLPTPPQPLSPPDRGALSGGAITWRGDPSVASVIVIDDVRGAQCFRAFTSEGSIPLSRLAALGLPGLEVGAHTLDLQTTAGADIDSLAEPDQEVRAQRFGLDQPGGATYQRFPFTVSP